MAIFHDTNGLPIKFFIQKDIAQQIQAELCETIASLGGRVDVKVPRAGYVLIQPGTAEQERLRLCWTSPDRPERYFVPYTFVDACKINGTLLKQIFLQDGQPIRMHIDSSIANVNVRAALSQRITHSGGDSSASAQGAQVILADPNTEVFKQLVQTYQSQPGKYVESYLWVKKCVEKGQLSYTPVVYKNPGGRRAGEERTHFTEDDETHLCNWIAMKIPFKETGGRTGNRLYQQLVEMAGSPEYNWVSRHTWQSWRERYKKNSARLDPKIAEIVQRNKPSIGEKGQYGYVRKPEEKFKKSKKKPTDGEEHPGAGPPNEELDMISGTLIYTPLQGNITGTTVASSASSFPLTASVLPPVTVGEGPGPSSSFPISAEVLAARQNASEEEDDEGEWQIKEGDGPPPAWAKRKAPSEEEEEGRQGPQKKFREEDSQAEVEAAIKNISIELSASVAPSQEQPLHVVDQAILNICREFRFTVEEVKEYYDSCGDVNRTTNRFRKMREVLANLPDDQDAPTYVPQPVVKPAETSIPFAAISGEVKD